MKHCPCCKQNVPLADYYTCKGKPQTYCKSCWKQKAKEKYVKPSKEQTRAYTLKSRFGISIEDYEQLYTNQNGKCAICKKDITKFAETRDLTSTACVDHNHTTGKVRGLLCNHCNTAIGLLQEDESIMHAAINYLKDRGVK